MKQKQLQKKYSELIKSGESANGRKETVSFFHKAEKVRTKILNKTKKTCPKCKGIGFKRITLEVSKTCLHCYGNGFILREFEKV
tara:strand:+ start:352 stop:603 length:252 start_codon:yes stop_codon:yes gene_type:complete